MKNIAWAVALSAALALALPARAQESCSQNMGSVVNEAQAKAGEILTGCAQNQGVDVGGTPVVLAVDGSSAAIIPGAKVKDLTRDSFKDWQTLGVFTAQAPKGAEAPSGTFTLRAQAEPGKESGKFQVVDDKGKVVQEGEMKIQMAPEDSASSGKAGALPPGFLPPSGLKTPGGANQKLYYGYYPPFYYYPFYIHPYYYYGCYYWVYSWPWGHAVFHYCWWPWYPYWWYNYCWW
jgi:hypothetical protein